MVVRLLLDFWLCKCKQTSFRFPIMLTYEIGAHIFDLTVTSIDVIGPQQLVTEELVMNYIQHF